MIYTHRTPGTKLIMSYLRLVNIMLEMGGCDDVDKCAEICFILMTFYVNSLFVFDNILHDQ